MRVDKIKRPGGLFTFEAISTIEDEWGSWLFTQAGTGVTTPKASGRFEFDAILLIDATNRGVAWFVDDPADRCISIDICLPPFPIEGGWSWVDLELDPKRHASGVIEVEDEDEFAEAIELGAIDDADAAVARAAVAAALTVLAELPEPYATIGWRHLERSARPERWTTAE